MFDVGFFELLIVAILGLVIIGPERLPDAVRTTAKWWARIKHSLANARNELEREIGADDIRREIHNDRVLRELRESRTDLENTLSRTQKSISEGFSSEASSSDQNDTPRSVAVDSLPPEGEPNLEDPDYPEHLHEHGDPAHNPQHPQHTAGFESEGPTRAEQPHAHPDNDKQ